MCAISFSHDFNLPAISNLARFWARSFVCSVGWCHVALIRYTGIFSELLGSAFTRPFHCSFSAVKQRILSWTLWMLHAQSWKHRSDMPHLCCWRFYSYSPFVAAATFTSTNTQKRHRPQVPFVSDFACLSGVIVTAGGYKHKDFWNDLQKCTTVYKTH